MDLDRQAIERRDFPIGRRGYDTAAVDAHLRALGAEFEDLQRLAVNGGAESSLASTASTQVQSILAAAETAAGEIERQAMENAQRLREEADGDAERTREEAIEKARAHVAAVAQVASTLLERVGSMDGQVNGLIESLQGGAGRLTRDLAALDSGMGELYDAASGRAPKSDAGAPPASLDRSVAAPEDALAGAPQRTPSRPFQAAAPTSPATEATAGGDLDGARLIALNMALNGESREDTERYLAENFDLPDRPKLISEVYAAVEG